MMIVHPNFFPYSIALRNQKLWRRNKNAERVKYSLELSNSIQSITIPLENSIWTIAMITQHAEKISLHKLGHTQQRKFHQNQFIINMIPRKAPWKILLSFFITPKRAEKFIKTSIEIVSDVRGEMETEPRSPCCASSTSHQKKRLRWW